MSIDLEYAIKKDIRNNPVLREEDSEQKREFRRIVWLSSLAVGLLLFSAWQHFETLDHSMQIEQLRVDRANEEKINRKLKLNLETLRAPEVIEDRARKELGLEPASLRDTLVVERARASSPSAALVARSR